MIIRTLSEEEMSIYLSISGTYMIRTLGLKKYIYVRNIEYILRII